MILRWEMYSTEVPYKHMLIQNRPSVYEKIHLSDDEVKTFG